MKIRHRYRMIMMLFLVLMGAIALKSIGTEAGTINAKKITLNHSVYTLKKGKKVQLKGKITPYNASNRKIVWSTSRKSVATVSKKGVVTAKRKGKATIIARIKGTKKKAVCKIIVGTPVTKVTISKTNLTLTIGQSKKLTAKVYPSKASIRTVRWTSSAKSIATVTTTGTVKAVKAGKARITVTTKDGTGKKAICYVTVKKPVAPADETTVKPESEATTETSSGTTEDNTLEMDYFLE